MCQCADGTSWENSQCIVFEQERHSNAVCFVEDYLKRSIPSLHRFHLKRSTWRVACASQEKRRLYTLAYLMRRKSVLSMFSRTIARCLYISTELNPAGAPARGRSVVLVLLQNVVPISTRTNNVPAVASGRRCFIRIRHKICIFFVLALYV